MSIEAAKALKTAEVRLYGPAPLLNQNPNFNSPQWALFNRDQIIPVAQPGFTSVKLLEFEPHKPNTQGTELFQKTVTELAPKIEEVKKALSYNPSKKAKQYDEMGRLLIRRRGRGGRCARIPHDSAESCPTPDRCRRYRGGASYKENKNESAAGKQSKRINRQTVILNGKKIK